VQFFELRPRGAYGFFPRDFHDNLRLTTSLETTEETVARDPRYDILFEPVKIGPVTAKNRFYREVPVSLLDREKILG
jgi:hypothetical protein